MRNLRAIRRTLHAALPLLLVGCGDGLESVEPLEGAQEQSQSLDQCGVLAYRIVNYGQMGRRGCGYADRCASGLVPQNVDTRAGYNYAKAEDGWFSCWGNVPDVNCYSQPKLYSYINVRTCYTRPDGSKVDYGCGC